jgi:hypothetical protein
MKTISVFSSPSVVKYFFKHREHRGHGGLGGYLIMENFDNNYPTRTANIE